MLNNYFLRLRKAFIPNRKGWGAKRSVSLEGESVVAGGLKMRERVPARLRPQAGVQTNLMYSTNVSVTTLREKMFPME